MKKWQKAAVAVSALAATGGMLAGFANVSYASSLPKGQTITVWSWAGGAQLASVKKIAAQWATAHGDTVKVVDESSNPKGFQFYATAARTGKGPDVVFGMPHDNNGTFAEEGLMAKVPSGIINTKLYAPSTINAIEVNGTEYSVPVSVQTVGLYYNKKLVPNAPKNWSQFVADANAHGFMYDQANLYYDYALIGGMGGYVFKNNNGTLNPNDIGLANAGAVKAYTLMYDMDAKYHWMTPSTNGTVAVSQFEAGKIGMVIDGPWDTANIQKAGIDFGVAPWPTLSNGKHATPFLGVITAFVNSKSQTQPADWSLVQALSNSYAQIQYFQSSQQIPAYLGLQKTNDIQGNATFKAFSSALQYAVPMPNIPQMQAVWTADTVLTNIISGKVSPAKGAQDFVNNIKKGIAALG